MNKVENKRLGKGLDAIFGENLSEILEEMQQDENSLRNEIKVLDIRPNPYQPRKNFDREKLTELAQSIKEHGVFTPILVRQGITGYELIAGERRLRACKEAGLETIPAIILELSDEKMMEISVLENIQREDLNAIEEATAYNTLLVNLAYTQDQLAQRLGKSRTHITNMLRILRLPQEIQQMVMDEKLTMGHVRPLITLDDEHKMIALAEKIIKEGLSVREVEQLLKPTVTKVKPEVKPDIFLENVKQIMENKLQTKTEVTKNKLIIHYEDVDDLNRILEILDCLEEEND
ncbi:MAG: ParB/RepB/Spo0J family partition protein [Erysipelotrichaceae bacterium]|nr:ParB/RepB/Spo0J family partition protein [Erysipelotrichaceae bacterium]